MNFPVGSEAILPVIGSQEAKMWWDRMVGSGMSMVVGVSGFSMESGCTRSRAILSEVVVNFVERWFFRVWSR